jgi:hypothetical protein
MRTIRDMRPPLFASRARFHFGEYRGEVAKNDILHCPLQADGREWTRR